MMRATLRLSRYLSTCRSPINLRTRPEIRATGPATRGFRYFYAGRPTLKPRTSPSPDDSTTTVPGAISGPEISPSPPPTLSPSPSGVQVPNTNLPGYLTPKPANHHDLASFLQYAERTGLDPNSTVYVGTHFEYTVAATLSLYGFRLHRIGGASDAGIDLLGTWSVPIPASSSEPPTPTTPTTIRVILQCKVTSAPRPALIRELEGAFIGAPQGWKTSSSRSSRLTSSSTLASKGAVLGFLVAHKPATRGIRDALGRSRWPMGYIFCSQEGVVEQMVWNQRAVDELGLEGLGVVRRYGVPEGGQQVTLTWKGKALGFVGGNRIGESSEGSDKR